MTTINLIANSDFGLAPNNSSNVATAYEASRVIKASPGVVFGVSGYNSGAAQFLHLYDAIAVPANGVKPDAVIAIAGTGNFSIDLGIYGRGFVNGICIGNSTTGPSRTAGAADCWFDVRFK